MTTYDPDLQKTLDKLWFRLPDQAAQRAMGWKTADLGCRQEWLVRIFQSCAKRNAGDHRTGNDEVFGARENSGDGPVSAERLTRVKLPDEGLLPADFVPHGRVDTLTKKALDAWSAEAARLRCPVIFQARVKARRGDEAWSKIRAEGFFFHDQLQDKIARVFVRDFTSPDPVLPDGKPPLLVVGTAVTWGNGKNPKWGIQAKPAHSLPDVGHFDPDHVIGKSWSELTPVEQSNFRVVAALATVEAGGVFDGMNAYDTSVLSLGPYHYTAFPVDKKGNGLVGRAELGAFLAYWATRGLTEYPAFRDAIGVAPTTKWAADLRDDGHRTYSAELGFADPAKNFVPLGSPADRDYLRTYYIFYRFQAGLRFLTSMKKSFWPYARQRVADVLSTPWSTGAPPGASKIGHVFKSERSIALLIRWHVFRPDHVVSHGEAGTVPQQIVKIAGLAKKPVSTWREDDEAALVKAFDKAKVSGLKGKSAKDLADTLRCVRAWADWPATDTEAGAPSLKTTRDFTLDTDELPFPPAGGVV